MRWERGIPEDMDLRMVRPFVLAPPPPQPPRAAAVALAECRHHGPPTVADLERLLAALQARHPAAPPEPVGIDPPPRSLDAQWSDAVPASPEPVSIDAPQR